MVHAAATAAGSGSLAVLSQLLLLMGKFGLLPALLAAALVLHREQPVEGALPPPSLAVGARFDSRDVDCGVVMMAEELFADGGIARAFALSTRVAAAMLETASCSHVCVGDSLQLTRV